MNIWDNEELLSKLEQERSRRKSDRITFDCVHLKCRENRAYCDKGRLLGQARDGSMSLLAVLRGITSGTCKNCEYFE